jgi:hypothetical protein
LNRVTAIILQNQIRAAVRRAGGDSLEITSAGQPDGTGCTLHSGKTLQRFINLTGFS